MASLNDKNEQKTHRINNAGKECYHMRILIMDDTYWIYPILAIHAIAGTGAGIITTLLLQPLDLVKIRFQGDFLFLLTLCNTEKYFYDI